MAPLFAKWLNEDMRIMLEESNERIPARIRKAKQDHETGKVGDRPSIFTAILNSSLPESEKTDYRLGGEGFSMISAGTETTAVSIMLKCHPAQKPNNESVDAYCDYLLSPKPTGNSGSANSGTTTGRCEQFVVVRTGETSLSECCHHRRITSLLRGHSQNTKNCYPGEPCILWAIQGSKGRIRHSIGYTDGHVKCYQPSQRRGVPRLGEIHS